MEAFASPLMYLLFLSGEAKTMYEIIERAVFSTCKIAINKPLDHHDASPYVRPLCEQDSSKSHHLRTFWEWFAELSHVRFNNMLTYSTL